MKLKVLFCRGGCDSESPNIAAYQLDDVGPIIVDSELADEKLARGIVNYINAGLQQLVAYCPYAVDGDTLLLVIRSHISLEHLRMHADMVRCLVDDKLSGAGLRASS